MLVSRSSISNRSVSSAGPSLHEKNFSRIQATSPAGVVGQSVRQRLWLGRLASIRVSGIAAQLTATKGAALRGLISCNAHANISLPTPDSPVNRTLASVLATQSNMCLAARKDARVASAIADVDLSKSVSLMSIAA